MADPLPCPFCGESLTPTLSRKGFPIGYAHPLNRCLRSGTHLGSELLPFWNSRIGSIYPPVLIRPERKPLASPSRFPQLQIELDI